MKKMLFLTMLIGLFSMGVVQASAVPVPIGYDGAVEWVNDDYCMVDLAKKMELSPGQKIKFFYNHKISVLPVGYGIVVRGADEVGNDGIERVLIKKAHINTQSGEIEKDFLINIADNAVLKDAVVGLVKGVRFIGENSENGNYLIDWRNKETPVPGMYINFYDGAGVWTGIGQIIGMYQNDSINPKPMVEVKEINYFDEIQRNYIAKINHVR